MKLLQPLNFDNWTERASSAGKLNTNPSGKTPMQKYEEAKAKIQELELKEKLVASQQKTLADLKAELPNLEKRKDDIILSETAKTHLKEIYWETRTGVRKDIHSKYFENGKFGEAAGISLVSQLDDPDLFDIGMPIYSKCDLPRVFGSHFQGECDIKHSPSIQDIKCCWDIFTFYPHVDELVIGDDGKSKWKWDEESKMWKLPKDNIENDDYYCQGIVYMELYGESEFRLRYVLVNMPDVLLEQQYKWILKEYGGKESDAYYAACAEFKKKHTFDHLPIESRVATFKIERNNAKYLDLCRRVEKAREFLNWYSEEMFYFENPSLRPVKVELIQKSLENIISENVFEGGYSDDQEKIESLEHNIELKLSEIEFREVEIVDGHESIENQVYSEENCYVKDEIAFVNNETGFDEPEMQNSIKEDFKLRNNEPKIGENHENIENETGFDEPSKEILEKLDLGIHDMVETQKGIEKIQSDSFLLSIQNLKTIDDAVSFYMENSSKIDDTQYEEIYFKKKDELSGPIEAPKVKKFAPISIPSAPIKSYTGNERYNISDGFKDIAKELTFDSAKNFILEYTKSKFPEWNELKLHRDGITTFVMANRELIERDFAFKDELAALSKEECKKLVDKAKEEIMKQVSKM